MTKNRKVSISKIEEGQYFVNRRGLIIWRGRGEKEWHIDAGEGHRTIKKEFGTLEEAKDYIVKHGLKGGLGGT